jgi:hypothetical protein
MLAMHKPELGNMYVGGVLVFYAKEGGELPMLLFRILPVPPQQQQGQSLGAGSDVSELDVPLDLPGEPISITTWA